jgi:hypothetical protein
MSPELRRRMKNSIFLAIASFALFHSLITGPLLVQCVLADGCTIPEMFGHDPHQHVHPDFSSGLFRGDPSHPILLDCDNCPDGCIDLVPDNSAVPGSRISGPLLRLIPAAEADSFQSPADPAAWIPNPACALLSAASQYSASNLSLRI